MKTAIDPNFAPHPEDVARLRADLAIDPLAYVFAFVEHAQQTGLRVHDWRAAFRFYVRDACERGNAKPSEDAPLSPEEQVPLARAALEALDKIGGTT